MKLFKITLAFLFTTFLVIFFGFNLVINNYNTYNKLPTVVHERILPLFNFLDIKQYGINNVDTKEALLFDFSKNDKHYNDSVLTIVKNSLVFKDEWKSWRKCGVIYKNESYKTKYRFHGGQALPYHKGYRSVKVKSNRFIKGRKQFNLMTCYHEENSFFNVFLSNESLKMNLISPEPGEIVVANLDNKLKDYWLTSDLSTQYIKNQYDIDDYYIFENDDNWERISGFHYSRLDQYYYYLDEENYLDKENNVVDSVDSKYQVFANFISKIQDKKASFSDIEASINKEYTGNFLAFLYLMHDPHHIAGDNNKWLYTFKHQKFYPISRNEGHIFPIFRTLDFDRSLFENRYAKNGYENSTFMFYKKAMCNDSVKFYRDQALYNIVKNKENIIKRYDSIYNKYQKFHQFYNDDYFKIRNKTIERKNSLVNNIDFIKQYLTINQVAIAFDLQTKELKIVSDSRVPLQVKIKDEINETLLFRTYYIDSTENIANQLQEHRFILSEKISKNDISITNTITGEKTPADFIIFNYF